MKQPQLVIHPNKLLLIIMLVLMTTSTSVSAKEKDCWADFYEFAQFIGRHVRLNGPIELTSLRNVNGENWESRIDSIIIGPKAKVTIFENINFKLTLTEMANHPDLMKSLGITMEEIKQDSELIFHPDDKIDHLGVYNFHKKTKSLKIECKK